MITALPLPTTSMSSPAVRFVAIIPLVPPVRPMSRPAVTVPSVMLLLARPFVSISASTAADVMPISTLRALAITLLAVLVRLSTSMLSAMAVIKPPAIEVPPIRVSPAIMLVAPPEVSDVKVASPEPDTEITPPAFTVPSDAFPPKLTLNPSAAVALPAVTVSALIVIEPSVAVDCAIFAEAPPLTRIAPWSAVSMAAVAPPVVVSVTLSLARPVPSVIVPELAVRFRLLGSVTSP